MSGAYATREKFPENQTLSIELKWLLTGFEVSPMFTELQISVNI